jgi:hypothetical protein
VDVAPASAPSKRRPVFRAIGLAVLVAFVTYAAFAVYLATRPVVISLDAVQRFRESLPVGHGADDAAWPGYRDALMAMGYEKGVPKDEGIRDALGCRPGDDDWKSIAPWIDARQAPIIASRTASKRPVFGFPVGHQLAPVDAALLGDAVTNDPFGTDWRDRDHFPMFALTLPHYAVTRSLARVLSSDLFRAAETDDGARATEDVQALMALSMHVPEGRLVIGDLIGMAIRRIAATSIIGVLEWKPEVFTEQQLRRMQSSLRSVPVALERLDLASERLAFQDVVQRMYSDDGDGDGWFVPTWSQLRLLNDLQGVSGGAFQGGVPPWVVTAFVGALRPLGAFGIAGRKDTLSHYDALIARFEQVPTASARQALGAVGDIDAALQRQMSNRAAAAHWFLESLLAPALGQAVVNVALDRATRESACAAIAAELFHRANKRWPTTAAELASFNGGIVPADPWTDGPIRMAIDDAGFRMWSMGRDGKEDGGDPLRTPALSTNPNPRGDASGDWVWFAPRGNLDRWRN